MPEISLFFGIRVTMYYDDHNPPHFHAYYNKCEAIFTLDGKFLNYQSAIPSGHETRIRVNKSILQYEKEVFVPYWYNASPSGSVLTTSEEAFDKETLTYTVKVSYSCTAQYKPEAKQGFTIALYGKPRTGSYNRNIILSKTEEDYLKLEANSGESTAVTVQFELADGVQLADYKDLRVGIFYATGGDDGVSHQRIKLTQEQFESSTNNGVIMDYSAGVDDVQ